MYVSKASKSGCQFGKAAAASTHGNLYTCRYTSIQLARKCSLEYSTSTSTCTHHVLHVLECDLLAEHHLVERANEERACESNTVLV